VSTAVKIALHPAKDTTQLLKAVELKLTEQRRFVVWWEQQEKAAGPGRGKKASRTGNGFLIAGRNGLPDRDTIRRWRTRLLDDNKYEATLAAGPVAVVTW